MTKPSDKQLEEQIRGLLEDAGIPVTVTVRDQVAQLVGRVDSIRLREAAIDLAVAVEGVVRVDDQIDYEVISPDQATDPPDVDGELSYADDVSTEDDIPDDEPSFMAEVDSSRWQQVIEEGGTYFPPTDPVVRPSDDDQELEVLGGFQSTSMENLQTQTSDDLDEATEMPIRDSPVIRDDDEIRDDVLRELAEDALTTDLDIVVSVMSGIVLLQGEVATVEDAENAEAVAMRIAGVLEVRDMTALSS